MEDRIEEKNVNEENAVSGIDEIESFEEIVDSKTLIVLNKRNIKTPTAVQRKVMHTVRRGDNVICQAPTGSGKTLAYLLPLMLKIDEDINTPQILIVTPTHELAVQVTKIATMLCDINEYARSALLIGGTSIDRQLEQLKNKPKIVVGSMGRIIQLSDMKKLKLHTVKAVVFDEGDRLVDKNNIAQTTVLLKKLLRDTQKLVFSASMSDEAINTATQLLGTATVITVDRQQIIPKNIRHIFFEAEQRKKIELLRKILWGEKIEKAIVFINKEDDILHMTRRLNYHKIPAVQMRGDTTDAARMKAMKQLESGKARVLVASDLVSRGLDIDGMDYIINLSMPKDVALYQHRAGRTGRAGKKGTAISIVDKSELSLISKYEREFNIKIQKCVMQDGKIVKVVDEKMKKQPTEISQDEKRKAKKKTKVYSESNPKRYKEKKVNKD